MIFIDIETRASDTMPDISEVKVPGNISRPDTILKYQQENQVEAWKKQALDSMQGNIVCIGYAFEDGPVKTFCHKDESQVMFEFAAFINELQGAYNESIKFCGWNIMTFDIPWLWRKAIKYNHRNLINAIPKDNKHFAIDLMKIWAADFRDYVSLDSCAKFLNIPHDTCKGSEIHDYWQAGDYASISSHCVKDIETTMEIYKRIFE